MIKSTNVAVLVLFCVALIAGCSPVGFVKQSGKTLEHTFSGVQFPPRVGQFVRVSTNAYNPMGSDVSVGYTIRKPNCDVTLTMYVYPIGTKSFNDEISGIKNGITYYNSSAELLVEDTFEINQGGKVATGTQLRYQLSRGSGGVLSNAYLFIRGDQFVKYRISYSNASKTCMEDEVNKFLQEVKWIE